ncbi:UDP-N-acetylglucosamine 1-carboxyvinyltransferase [Herbidospora sp. NEAU-GS84]|uniref:UDP-N-acetylglucosamine 1-carboxyvinyltransferase n=1 Tax=Herbidospora solisilvae TaxID=2696284 RepID=A0A7C9J0V4_9ACTN|nr:MULTISPECIES: UDP-N-acetylglucosamine 1-carboxyvinyltransferase [Herbidospora]NAS21186.1 UDP-N-acetylglucosamine 1-carboxyvinyltransferase [Herbidospora solisilvae]GLX92760.1 UDP-N-acetylglucosamine 1-carboxyvinyltransferase [Herbidospora sp. NBRC 101105]
MNEQAWLIEPSGPLRGDVEVRGSKNAVSKHMVAAMLGDGPSTLHNAPEVGEVHLTAAMLEALGIHVEIGDGEITLERGSVIEPRVPEKYTGLNRIPILMLGPLLHLAGEAFVPMVGGDPIGRRPVNFHLEALRSMGAEIIEDESGITAKASRLHGTRITLPYPSVGATETILMTAVLAEGKTVIKGAAMEPEVVELALYLQRMGAMIELSPDRRIVIEGVEKLHGASTWLAGDRIEAFSYLVAGLVTGGEVRVHGCPQDRLVTAITTLARMGARFDITDDWLTASAPDGLRAAAVQTDTHPGFMTDWQTPLMVLFTRAEGMSVLHETVFENRLVYVPALQKMGCEIEVFSQCLGGPACRYHDTNAKHSAVVRGVSKLRGADVTLPDIRAGFSAVLAAAVAEGTSTLRGVNHIERGYHRPFDQFTSLGLKIRRADV